VREKLQPILEAIVIHHDPKKFYLLSHIYL